jgi:hypothetical protein
MLRLSCGRLNDPSHRFLRLIDCAAAVTAPTPRAWIPIWLVPRQHLGERAGAFWAGDLLALGACHRAAALAARHACRFAARHARHERYPCPRFRVFSGVNA